MRLSILEIPLFPFASSLYMLESISKFIPLTGRKQVSNWLLGDKNWDKGCPYEAVILYFAGGPHEQFLALAAKNVFRFDVEKFERYDRCV